MAAGGDVRGHLPHDPAHRTTGHRHRPGLRGRGDRADARDHDRGARRDLLRAGADGPALLDLGGHRGDHGARPEARGGGLPAPDAHPPTPARICPLSVTFRRGTPP